MAEHPKVFDFFAKQYSDNVIWCDDTTDLSSISSDYVLLSVDNSSHWINVLSQYGYCVDSKASRMCRSIAFFEQAADRFAINGLVFKRQSPRTIAQDAMIAWASGREFFRHPGVKAYVNSLNRCGFEGDKIVFTHDMPLEDREYMEDQGFQVIDVDPKSIKAVVHDRFKIWADYLGSHKYRYVGLMDIKDVVFQRNPIAELELLDCSVCLIAEGKKHSECNWNAEGQEKIQSRMKDFKLPYLDWEVINSGTILGCGDDIKHLAMLIWSTSLMGRDVLNYSEQAVLNYLFRIFPNSNYHLSDPRFENMAVTADLPKDGPIFENGLMLNGKTHVPYAIYHQWDRVPVIRELIVEEYK
jgi:hypothetical protein